MGGFSTVTPSGGSVNATSVAQAVWSYTPRSLTNIQSLTAAIQNNDPSLLSTLSDLQYLPVPYYIGQVSATQVSAFIDNAIRNYNMAGAFASFISNNPYNLWSSSFVAALVNQYITATSLNMLILQPTMSGNGAQEILYALAQNYYYNNWVNIVTANAPSSITFSTNAVLSTNVLIARNITIASGVTVTCGTRTCFFVAQSFNNYGTIVSHNGAAGGSANIGGGSGGAGGGGVIILAITAVLGTINVNGSAGGTNYMSANSYTTDPGSPGDNGLFAVLSGMTVPVGGTGGVGSTTPGAGEPNGGGGGSMEPGGNGGASVVLSFSNGNALVTYVMQGLSDWWLINVVGKAPSTTTPLLYVYGSGGGGGGSNGNVGFGGGGGGGGGGGEVIVYGYNIISGTIDASGGAGGGAVSFASTNRVGGGGGGGGGIVFVFYNATSGSITANVAGGAGGPISGTGSAGATGANGTAYIAQVTVNR